MARCPASCFLVLAALVLASCATLDPGIPSVPSDGVWDDLGEYSEGLIAVRSGGRWGYADTDGGVAIVPQFAHARPFSQGLAAVRLTEKWGFTDRAGRYAIRPTYLDSGDFSEDLAPVRTDRGWGYVDRAGKIAIQPAYDEALSFSQGLAPVRLGSRWGYIERSGALAIGFEYKAALPFSGDLAPAAIMRDDNEWGYIDRSGKFRIAPAFDGAKGFSEDRAAVLLDGRWGYVDRGGGFVVNPRLDAAEAFAGNFAPVRSGGLWGLMYEDGRYFVPPRWAELGPYRQGRARAVSPSGAVRSIDVFAGEAPLRAEYARAAAPRPAGAGTGKKSGSEVTLRVKVTDFISGAPVRDFAVARILAADGEHELPEPRPRSGADGVLDLTLDEDLAARAKELLGAAPGYREAPLDVAERKYSYEIALLSLAAELPRIDEVLLTRERGGESVTVNVLMQQEEFQFRKPGMQRVSFNVHKGPFAVTRYYLQQGSRRIESDKPEFDVDIGGRFVKDETIHAGLIISYRDTMVTMPTYIKVRNPPELEKPVNFSDVPQMKLPENVKFLGGLGGGYKVPGLTFGVDYEDDLITIYFGQEKSVERGGDKWKNAFKSWMKDTTTKTDYFKQAWGYLRKNQPKPPTTGSGALAASIGAIGYVELSYGKTQELQVVGGRLLILGEFGYEFSGQTMVGFIPVYASFGVGGDLSILFKGEGDDAKAVEEFFTNVTFTLSPYVDFEGGVGVKGLLSVGVGVHGDMPMKFQTRPVKASGNAIIDIQIRARLLFAFHWEYLLARGEFHLFGDKTEGGGPEITGMPGAGAGPPGDFAMDDLAVLPGMSRWLGDQVPPVPDYGKPPVIAQPLKTNIMPGSEPLLTRLADTEFLLWTDAAPGRAKSANAAALFFSIRNRDGSWTAPEMVHDDGTADYEFAAVEHRGILYVTWQNTSKVFEEDKIDYGTACVNSQILVAAWDPARRAFAPPKHIDGPVEGNYFGRPRLASDGTTMGLSFVRNNSGDYFLQKGSTYIQYVRMDKDAWMNFIHPLRYPDRPVTGYDLAVSGGDVYAVSAEDLDGSFDTVDDRMIYLTYSDYDRNQRHVEHRVSVTDRKGKFSNPRVARRGGSWTLFYYGGDEKGAKGNYYYYDNLFGTLGTASRKAVFGTPGLLPEDFSLVPGPDGKLGLLFTDADGGSAAPLESAPTFVMYDGAGGRWSLPVRAWTRNPQPGMKAEAARGAWTDAARIDIAYRSLPVKVTWNPDDRKDTVPTTLAFASIVPAPDLEVDPSGIYRYYEPEVAGGLVKFDVDIVNKGFLPAEGIYTDVIAAGLFSKGFQKAYRSLVIQPGQKITLPMEFRIDGRTLGGNLVSVRTIRGKELYTANNTAPVRFMDPQLGFTGIDMVRSGFERRFAVGIENRSAVRVNDVVLHLYDGVSGSNEVRRVELGTLMPNKSARAQLAVPLQDLNWGDAQRKLLRFELTSSDVMKGGIPGENFVVFNPYAYPAFGLSVFDARVSGARFVYLSAAATNNHPVPRSGELLVELENGNGEVELARSFPIRADSGGSAIVTNTFAVKGDPRTYKVRVSMKNAPRAAAGSPETGGLMAVGGDPVVVEAFVKSGPGDVYAARSGRSDR